MHKNKTGISPRRQCLAKMQWMQGCYINLMTILSAIHCNASNFMGNAEEERKK